MAGWPTEIQKEYRDWLISLVGGKKGDVTFVELLRVLFKKEYFWTVPNDDNRASDGKGLRGEYIKLVNGGTDIRNELEGPCRILEMFIGLARRMELVMNAPTDGNVVPFWFWCLIENLGLDTYDDTEIFELGAFDRVDMILDVFLERRFKRNGEGGLFPLRGKKGSSVDAEASKILIENQVYPLKDQRGVEVWYQMCEWMLENHMDHLL